MDIITGNSKVLRSINRGMILNIIREMEPISRTGIAKLTGLNKSTVSSIIFELLNSDLISERVSDGQSVGRTPLNLYLKLNKHYVGGINIDSSVTRFVVADIDGSVKGTSSIDTEPENAVEFVNSCIHELMRLGETLNVGRLEALGVSVAGIVDSKNMMVNFAPNLDWEDFNIGEVIRTALPQVENIAVGNDAKSSALAELWFGNHEIDLNNFVFLSIGPGIGSGIVVDGKLMTGEYQASGEFGHMIIYEGGAPCRCGGNGCWEAYASDRATVSRYMQKKHGTIDHTIDFMIQDIISLAKSGDDLAVEVLKQTGYYLGLGIANIIKAVDPHAIIVDGRTTQAWDIIYPEIMAVVMQRAYFGTKKNIKILPTSMKNSPRLMGAAALAIEQIFDGYKITD
ncbi:MAG: ROK family transcriptional regulator [Bacteroidetes bacterium]|nr:ROK family transcriptional regulator [Bacteroidota bacterium]MCL5737628.1 ROK family transcriptional regulator [Bacteroidota bacterium]